MLVRTEQDKSKATLGLKWSRLFRPFKEGEYPNELSSVPPGWLDLMDRFLSELDLLLPQEALPAIDRLQAKNGHLEAWWAFVSPPGFDYSLEFMLGIEDLLTKYEDLSWNVCGVCGAYAKEDSGEHVPVCDTCQGKVLRG